MYHLSSAVHDSARHPALACIDVEHLMSPRGDVAATLRALDWVGSQLGVLFNLRHDAGDIVLLDGALQGRLSPQLLHSLREDRPLVTLPGLPAADESLSQPVAHDPQAVLALLQQFKAIPALAQRCQTAGAPGSPTHAGLPVLLQQVLQGREVPETPALWASYGPLACMHFDFASRQVICDALALQHLRLHRELPQQAAWAELQPKGVKRSLAKTLWDLGIAAGPSPLLDAPADFWLAPLRCVAGSDIHSYTRWPMHLDALRLLQSAPLSPTQLQRRVRTGMAELRQLLQAGLLTGLLQWAPFTVDQGSS